MLTPEQNDAIFGSSIRVFRITRFLASPGLTPLRLTSDNSPTTAPIHCDDSRGTAKPNQEAPPVNPLDGIPAIRLSGRLFGRDPTGEGQELLIGPAKGCTPE